MDNASAPVGHRVIVTGMPGSGKSTFSRALSARTGLPLIHLDLHYWKPGWVRPSDDEWRVKQRSLLAGDGWIADGNYHETLDLRLERADTVVVLDTPWWVCSARAFLRGVRRPVGTVMPDGCDDSVIQRLRDEWRAVWVNWRDRRKQPERERAIISEYGQHGRCTPSVRSERPEHFSPSAAVTDRRRWLEREAALPRGRVSEPQIGAAPGDDAGVA